jgi:hypothetical protein
MVEAYAQTTVMRDSSTLYPLPNRAHAQSAAALQLRRTVLVLVRKRCRARFHLVVGLTMRRAELVAWRGNFFA